jgi:hypothetical protein
MPLRNLYLYGARWKHLGLHPELRLLHAESFLPSCPVRRKIRQRHEAASFNSGLWSCLARNPQSR